MRLTARSVLGAGIVMTTLGCAPSRDGSLAGGHGTVRQAASLLVASADAPTVGPEFDLGQPLVDSSAATELGQVIATNDSGVALVVWSVGNADIYAARVAPDGTVVDPAGIAVSATDLAETSPSVASDGSDWYVTWSGKPYGGNGSIFGARVTSTGEVSDSTVIAAPASDRDQDYSSVAYGGADFLVSWIHGTDIDAARVGADGSVLDPTPILLGSGRSGGDVYQPAPALGFDGTNWLAVWNSERFRSNVRDVGAIMETRVSPAGALIDPTPSVISGTPLDSQELATGAPGVACHAGSGCFVAWGQIVGSWSAGWTPSVVGQSSFIAFGGGGLDVDGRPGVAWHDGNWQVAWWNNDGNPMVNLERISPVGARVDPQPVAVAATAGYVAVASTPSASIVTYAAPWSEPGTLASLVVDGSPTRSFVSTRARSSRARRPTAVQPWARAARAVKVARRRVGHRAEAPPGFPVGEASPGIVWAGVVARRAMGAGARSPVRQATARSRRRVGPAAAARDAEAARARRAAPATTRVRP